MITGIISDRSSAVQISALNPSLVNRRWEICVFCRAETRWGYMRTFLPLSHLCSDALQQPYSIIAFTKLHQIFISDRKLKRTSDPRRYLSWINFPVSPKVGREFSDSSSGVSPPTPAIYSPSCVLYGVWSALLINTQVMWDTSGLTNH